MPIKGVDIIRQACFIYGMGYSSRETALILGISKSCVGKAIKDNLLGRDRISQAIEKSPVIKGDNWRSCRCTARKKYQRFHGVKLDRKTHVHHIDGDYKNNDISNLTILSASDHARLHGTNPNKKWTMEYKREYMKKYLRDYYKRKKAERDKAS